MAYSSRRLQLELIFSSLKGNLAEVAVDIHSCNYTVCHSSTVTTFGTSTTSIPVSAGIGDREHSNFVLIVTNQPLMPTQSSTLSGMEMSTVWCGDALRLVSEVGYGRPSL